MTFIGAEAGASSNSGESNTFVGQRSGWKNTSGQSNTFVGRLAGAYNTTGDYNTFMGRAAGYENSTGNYNTFIGYNAGCITKTIGGHYGHSNTFIGAEAGYNNTAGYYNIFVERSAGKDNTIGYANTFIGYSAGRNTTTIGENSGEHNTIVGYHAGYHNETGSQNVFLGNEAGFYETGSNKLYIDNSAIDTPLIWGDFSTRNVVIYGGFRAVIISSPSDRRWKKNIEPLSSSLTKISNLQGVSYEWKTDEYPDCGLTEGKQIGLVAQDVERVLPELVSEDKDGYKAVSYSKLTAVLVEAVKELKAENDRLKLENLRQQAEIEELRSIIKKPKS